MAVLAVALMLSTDDILLGLGLVVVLAIGSRVVAQRLRIPAIVLLLPVGFAAGAADRKTCGRTRSSAPSSSPSSSRSASA